MQQVVDKIHTQAGGFVITIFAMMTLQKERSVTMNIADRIHHLRKTKGISQEELADKIGVSRQAVSKWESEQTSPDIEKVILLSNYFDVTTDYLLKGIEPVSNESVPEKEKTNAVVFTIVGTALNFMGLIAAAMIWYEKQIATATAGGFVLIVMGCMIFGIGMAISDVETKEKAKLMFWTINIWILLFMPMSLVYNILSGSKGAAPYPIPIGSFTKYILFWAVYIVIGVAINLIIHKAKRK